MKELCTCRRLWQGPQSWKALYPFWRLCSGLWRLMIRRWTTLFHLEFRRIPKLEGSRQYKSFHIVSLTWSFHKNGNWYETHACCASSRAVQARFRGMSWSYRDDSPLLLLQEVNVWPLCCLAWQDPHLHPLYARYISTPSRLWAVISSSVPDRIYWSDKSSAPS